MPSITTLNSGRAHSDAEQHQPSRRDSMPMISAQMLSQGSVEKSALCKEDLEGIRVLIAEDNKVNVKVLTRTLERIGVTEIDVVGNGKEAVEQWDKGDYKLIFMDLQMPIMDGIEATHIITKRKTELAMSYPKVIFLTAHALQDYQDRAQEVGGDGFISKPFKLDIIKAMIQTLVTGK